MSLFDFIVPLMLGFNIFAIWYIWKNLLKPWLVSKKTHSESQGKNDSE